MRHVALLCCSIVIAVLAGCKMGADFKRPDETLPEQFASNVEATPGAPTASSASPPVSFWWQEFHDAKLDELESRAAAGNLDLKAAYLRIVEARMQVQAARAQGLPSLNASASYNREQLGLAGILKSQHVGASGPLPPAEQGLISSLEKPTNLYQLGFDASWELDLFGKVRRSVEAADAQRQGAEESRNDLLVSLQAEIAQDYLQLRAAQLLSKVTAEQVSAQKDVVELTESRHANGLASEADLDSAKGQYASLKSQLPGYEATLGASRHALAVLVGETPETFDANFGDHGDLPPMPASVPVGIPSQLARRRPDIRKSEAALHAATAEEGVAVASLFPDVSLSGTLGLRNLTPGYLFDWDSHFYTFGPTVSIPIFHAGALVANVKISKAQAAEAALAYRKSVLGALQEVEDGLDNLAHDAQRTQALGESVAADQRALDVDVDAYKHGLVTYIIVLTAQVQAVQAQQQLAQARLTQGTDLVKLYKALGGGWQEPSAGGSAGGEP
ncbi:MAG TPA: efflux transporter outer membrane subunit [Steroidobacteraceae bacterium]|jgi:NodT family efflux transporter outer membrane factor (OMF) lipoprotein